LANRDIVAIGASAGGIDILRRIVAALPADLAAAIFVVLHIGPSRSILPDILSDAGPLLARFAENGERIRHSRIYIAPPDVHLLVADGHVLLDRGPRENSARPAIDPLFRSVAENFGARAIGVVLSGALNDGTAGLKTMKHHGGIAVVQNPAEATVPSMPQSALNAVDVDHIASSGDLAGLLTRLVAQTAVPGAPLPAEPGRAESITVASEIAFEGGEAAPRGATVLSCPDCGGRLSMVENGSVVRFTCTVGHVHTAESFLASQAIEIERALWMAVRANEERAALLRKLQEDAQRAKRFGASKLWQERAVEYENHAKSIRELLTRGDFVPRIGSDTEST